MIKILISGIFLLFFLRNNGAKAFTAQIDSVDNYSITGKLRNYDSGWIYLRHGVTLKKGMRKDSARVFNGDFSFSGKISGLEPFLLGVSNKNSKGEILPSFTYKGPFILSPGHLNIEGEFDWKFPLSAFGTKAQDEYNVFKRKVDPLYNKLNKIIDQTYNTKKPNKKRLDSLNTQNALILNEIKEVTKAQIVQFPNSLVSVFIAKSELVKADPSTLKLLYDGLTTVVKESVHGKELLEMIKSKEATDIGGVAPLFNMPNLTGQLVSLASNKGTYTLVDFWASWCGPCRREHPNLIKAYNTYADKGFKIISISMDTNKALWLKAVNEDKLTWVQLSDLKGMQSEVGKKYGITVLPMNFLIDKEGKIIARDLKGIELINKLKEVF